MDCYIVYFCTGEYSDYNKTPMAVFTSKQEAEKYAKEKRSLLNDLGCHSEGNNNKSKEYPRPDFDNMFIDYTGGWISIGNPIPLFSNT